MYILGISCYYHDSAAALIKDGKVVAAGQEERFSRKKHDKGFPIHAIQYCLAQENITIDQINYVAFYEKPLVKFERFLYQHLEMFPLSYQRFISSMPSWINKRLRLLSTLKKELKYRKGVLFVDHHMAHAAGSFFPSPFKKAAVLTIDGVGEWTTTAYGIGENTEITLQKEIKFPSSIGLLYSTITGYLGFSVNNSEYKVMGLSPYGEMNRDRNMYYRRLLKVIDIKTDGSYRLDMSYFKFHYAKRMPGEKLCDLLHGPPRNPEEPLTQRHKDIAAAVQLVTEDVVLKILNDIQARTKCENLVMSGGVALNSVCNGKILRNTKFKSVWIQPEPGDAGTSIGAALYVYHSVLEHQQRHHLEHAYLGPSFTDEEIHKVFLEKNIKFHECKNKKDVVQTTVELLAKEKVVGWFQGRMEWGPRALGSRSILADASNPKMKEILNLKVKHREHFRPFAPVVCEDDAQKFFECDSPIPHATDFMLMVYPVRKQWHKKIPAVTHVDGSGRLQTVRKNQNQLYYEVIKEFGKKSGIPILVNTSFNIRGEPIVCTPYDAYRCMMGTGIDTLVIGSFVVHRNENPQDMWDSEKFAHD